MRFWYDSAMETAASAVAVVFSEAVDCGRHFAGNDEPQRERLLPLLLVTSAGMALMQVQFQWRAAFGQCCVGGDEKPCPSHASVSDAS